jgi:solute carrier family 25 carnitine/acylcarnitine transporter 20/29
MRAKIVLMVDLAFDTIKTRVQCAPPNAYKGAADCFMQTVTKEGPRKLYAGALAPAIGWSVTDAVLMGSLHNYRVWFKDFGLSEVDPKKLSGPLADEDDGRRLSLFGHAVAGEPRGCQSKTLPIANIRLRYWQIGMFAGFSK